MAQMTIFSPDALMKQLENMGNVDRYAPKILDAGIEPLYAKIKKNAQKHSNTGEMAASLKLKKAQKSKDGTWVKKAQFTGYDKRRKPTPSDPRGVPNARKAMSLEYGTSKQPATPFIRPAVVATKNDCLDAMQGAFNKEVGSM